MISPESLRSPGVYRLVCRPALPKDTPDVLELTRRIWEGHDYIPMVWADWLRDPEGLLAVAEYGGRVVGLSKLTRLSPSEWWLEGLRVHPDFEGRGVASRLHDYLIDYWQRYGGGTIRLATASSRVQVHHLSLRTGFRKVGEITPYVAEAIPGLPVRFTGLQPGEERESAAFAMGYPSPTIPNGLMDVGWQWVLPSADPIAQAIARGRAWWWDSEQGKRQALLLAREDEEDGGPVLLVQLLVCPPEHLTAFLEDYRRLAGSLNMKQASWFAPLDPALEPALLAAGYQRSWENSLYIFEKKAE